MKSERLKKCLKYKGFKSFTLTTIRITKIRLNGGDLKC